MIGYMTANEAAEKWNISHRRVITLCNENRIENVAMLGNMWIIPSDAEKPVDKRKAKINDCNFETYSVTIEETVSQSFTLKIEGNVDLKTLINELYNQGHIIIEDPLLLQKKMYVKNSKNKVICEWEQF